MPQLDLVTYSSQILWTLITFWSLYIIVLKKILPLIAKTLKVRNKIAKKTQAYLEELTEISYKNKIEKSNDICNIVQHYKTEIVKNNERLDRTRNYLETSNYYRNHTISQIIKEVPEITLINEKL
jgi:hypothetical protein